MNDLQVCNENGELINMQIDNCNSALDFFDVISKKGPREFVTQMGKLNLKARELNLKESELRQKYDIAEMQENNKYRLATLDLKKTKLELQERYEQEKLTAQKELLSLQITEQSKCLQKLIDSANNAYNRKMNFYEEQLKSCTDFLQPQIIALDKELSVLSQQRDAAFGNQELLVSVQKQISRLTQARNSINEKFMIIQSRLTAAVELANLDFGTSVTGLLN